MNVLVTGGGGFVGQALVKYLKNSPVIKKIYNIIGRGTKGIYPVSDIETFDNKKIYSFKLDLTDTISIKQAFLEPIDVIFHLAGNALNHDNPVSIIDDNIKTTFNLLTQCKGNPRFVFASTANVYGQGNLEKPSVETDPTYIFSAYTATKFACEKLIEATTYQGKVNSLILRYIANVGPFPTHGLLKDVIHKVLNLKSFPLFGTWPGSIKPFIHTADTAMVTANLGLDNSITGIVNVGTSSPISVQDIVDLVQAATEKNNKYSFVGYAWHGDCRIVNISNKKMLQYIQTLQYPHSVDAVMQAIIEILVLQNQPVNVVRLLEVGKRIKEQ